MTASTPSRYRLDELRRLATSLAASVGVSPARAAALATHLLWFDAVGASFHGIARLPNWLDRIDRKEINPTATGRAILEHAGTAVFDAQNGLPPLALEMAAGIASEKARDVGIGVVRVRNIGETGPSAPITAGLAIGPYAAWMAGPSGSMSLALPTEEGLPALYDSAISNKPGEGSTSTLDWLPPFVPWIVALAGQDGWVITALSVTAMESLTAFHERSSKLNDESPLSPRRLANSRQEAREQGVSLNLETRTALKRWASRASLPWPAEWAD